MTIQLVDDQVTLKGELLKANDGEGSRTVVLLSGSGGSMTGMCNDEGQLVGVRGIVDGYRALNCNVLAVDYRGYGNSDGTPSSRGFYTDAMAMLAFPS